MAGTQMNMGDVNDVWAFITATDSVDMLKQMGYRVQARLEELGAAQGQQGAHMVMPHVQPSNVTSPGPLTSPPMTGPDPQGSTGGVQEAAKAQQAREAVARALGDDAAKRQGPAPVSVDVGPTSEDQDKQAQEIAQQQEQQRVEAQKRLGQQRTDQARAMGVQGLPEQRPQNEEVAKLQAVEGATGGRQPQGVQAAGQAGGGN